MNKGDFVVIPNNTIDCDCFSVAIDGNKAHREGAKKFIETYQLPVPMVETDSYTLSRAVALLGHFVFHTEYMNLDSFSRGKVILTFLPPYVVSKQIMWMKQHPKVFTSAKIKVCDTK